MTVAVGYARVSTAVQGASGLGLEAQHAAITTACRARGWELCMIIDDVVSSQHPSRVRPGLDAAIAAAAGGAIVVSRMDRLAGSISSWVRIAERASAAGVTIHALDSPDGDTAVGELMQTTLVAAARFERRLIGQRTREALAAARARGVVLGRPVECPPEVIDQIIALRRRRRMSARAIARWLDAEEVPAPRGGTRWNDSTVGNILARAGLTLRRGRPRAVPPRIPAGQKSRRHAPGP